jgi:hypothetical protein
MGRRLPRTQTKLDTTGVVAVDRHVTRSLDNIRDGIGRLLGHRHAETGEIRVDTNVTSTL